MKLDVGPLPGRCSDTIVGPPPPERLPATPAYPEYREPGDRPREYLLDVAAAARRDSYPLVGDRGLVEDICRELDVVAELLAEEQERNDELRAACSTAEAQNEIARGVADRALVRVTELDLLLRAERSRYEQELRSHHNTTSRLIAANAECHGLKRRIELAEQLRLAALSDVEDMRRAAIRASTDAAQARRTLTALFDISDVPDKDVVDVHGFDEPAAARTVTPRVDDMPMAAVQAGVR